MAGPGTGIELGADPEFIFTRGGKPVPAHEIMDLNCPFQKGKRDGFSLELNPLPRECRGLLINAVRRDLEEAEQFKAGLELASDPAYTLDVKKLKDVPKDVLRVGCVPSWNAYTGQEGTPNYDPKKSKRHYNGGHMHFGSIIHYVDLLAFLDKPKYSKQDMERANAMVASMVKLLDLFVAVPLSFLLDDPREYERRQVYGSAGEYRVRKVEQKYGAYDGGKYVQRKRDKLVFEYRVLSAQMWNHPFISQLAFLLSRSVIAWADRLIPMWDPGWEEDLQGAINYGIDIEQFLPSIPGICNPGLLFKLREKKSKWKSLRNFIKFHFEVKKDEEGPPDDMDWDDARDDHNWTNDSHKGYYPHLSRWGLIDMILNKDLSKARRKELDYYQDYEEYIIQPPDLLVERPLKMAA